MAESLDTATGRPVGLQDIPLALLAPRRFFSRVEDVAVYGWPLAILLAAVTLTGWATVQTGLIDRDVDRQVQERVARIESEQRDVVERSALRELYAQEYKRAVFDKTMARILVIVAEPLSMLAAVLLIAAVLYGVVALTGRKPEWHTLLTICIFAGFVDLLRVLVTFVLMLRYRTLEVDTSLGLLTRFMADAEGANPTALAALSGLLSTLDPFRVWFWLVVVLGLSTTVQLRGWRAWVTCAACWLAGGCGRAALAAGAVAKAAQATANT